MTNDLQKIRLVLQMLALPVVGQVRLLKDDRRRIEVLAEALSVTHQAVHARVPRELTSEQAGALVQLSEQLARLRRESSPPVWSELAMRQSSDWRQVRKMAREALVRFNWTLEVPPQQVLSENLCLN